MWWITLELLLSDLTGEHISVWPLAISHKRIYMKGCWHAHEISHITSFSYAIQHLKMGAENPDIWKVWNQTDFSGMIETQVWMMNIFFHSFDCFQNRLLLLSNCLLLPVQGCFNVCLNEHLFNSVNYSEYNDVHFLPMNFFPVRAVLNHFIQVSLNSLSEGSNFPGVSLTTQKLVHLQQMQLFILNKRLLS